jgi:carboxyl-terminal processing protease
LRGLILDLRWCPGGYLDDSRDVADLFLPRTAPNATVRYRNGRPDERTPHARDSFLNLPVVVLVNDETTGGAELIAAVLQDNKRARIAGQRTRGKASVQRRWSLAGDVGDLALTIPVPNMELKLTSGMLIRPSGKNLNRFADSKPTDDWGVRPDPNLEFRVSAALGQRLQEWWQQQTLRPGTDNSILPLDDPAADPQRQAALRLLLDSVR